MGFGRNASSLNNRVTFTLKSDTTYTAETFSHSKFVLKINDKLYSLITTEFHNDSGNRYSFNFIHSDMDLVGISDLDEMTVYQLVDERREGLNENDEKELAAVSDFIIADEYKFRLVQFSSETDDYYPSGIEGAISYERINANIQRIRFTYPTSVTKARCRCKIFR